MKLDVIRSIWPWLFLLSMSIFFEVWARLAYDTSFLFNLFNIQSILTFAAAPLLLGIGVTFVIIAGGIDLSIGFAMGFAAVVFATITSSLGGQDPLVALFIGVIATMLIVMVPGMVNGWLIAGLHIPPFIGTLGMYGVARGLGFIVADGVTVPVNNPILFQLGTTKIFGLIPIPVLITAIVVLIAHFVLSQTRFGQYTYARLL